MWVPILRVHDDADPMKHCKQASTRLAVRPRGTRMTESSGSKKTRENERVSHGSDWLNRTIVCIRLKADQWRARLRGGRTKDHVRNLSTGDHAEHQRILSQLLR